LFNDNFKKFEDGASEEIKNAGPKVSAVGWLSELNCI
jgi:hypothetical protein